MSTNNLSFAIGSRDFIKIKIDGKIVKGNSKYNKSSDYFEGSSGQAFNVFYGIDGPVFDLVNLKLKVTKNIKDILESFFTRGEKNIEIEVLRKESTKSGVEYSSYNVIYTGCRINNIFLSHDNDTNLLCEVLFTPEDCVSIELNVPSDDGSKTEKVGPITYDLHQGKIV